ncbi:MAG: argininosuccinate lyase [Bacteroidales bacterium]|nr:argininosuccinate lyase [Bacteroidales bacterium]
MVMKLWEKGIKTNELIEGFTVGKDRELDLFLAVHDVLGSIAHIKMLQTVGLLSQSELTLLVKELVKIYKEIKNNQFAIEPGIEDVHSQVEFLLTKRIGEAGKKIHSGRSRNDQVLLDLKLFMRSELLKLVNDVKTLFDVLIQKSEKNKDVLMPGYTHLQVAMPSSFGLWFGAYAESLSDDMILIQSAFQIVNQNPLGSAAGYGSSFPVNRTMTTELLGFDDLNYNAVYAHLGRGKTEKIVAYALSNLASTLSKLATDVCLYMSQNFNFVSLPDELTTGSSIMPHKKNPDVFELLRAKCNKIQNLPNEVLLITNNLPSGYFRDFQIIKESILPAFTIISNCINVAAFALNNLLINKDILKDEKYKYIFSVEEVNKKVLKGSPFRDAYKEIAEEILKGNFNPDCIVNHSHEGSIGNLCNEKIQAKFDHIYAKFPFQKIENKIIDLLNT